MRFDERYDEFGYEREDADYEEQINEYLTPREVMELLAIGKNTFYKMVQSGQLPAFRIGRQWRVRRADIELWADGRMGGWAVKNSKELYILWLGQLF